MVFIRELILCQTAVRFGLFRLTNNFSRDDLVRTTLRTRKKNRLFHHSQVLQANNSQSQFLSNLPHIFRKSLSEATLLSSLVTGRQSGKSSILNLKWYISTMIVKYIYLIIEFTLDSEAHFR